MLIYDAGLRCRSRLADAELSREAPDYKRSVFADPFL
jgi:hypothetical protein